MKFSSFIIIIFIFSACSERNPKNIIVFTKSPKEKMADGTQFNKMIDGKLVALFNLKSKNGMIVQVTNYGGKIVSIIVPDRNGFFDDIVTGYDNIDDYIKGDNSFGAIIGRYGNRIEGGTFSLDGVTYQLAKNNGKNHLHGGLKNFSNRVWDVAESDDTKLVLRYLSKDGEEGYPGNLDVTVTYSLTDSNELVIDYHAVTDKKTVVNLTNHTYFNLAGGNFEPIYEHELQLSAKYFVPGRPDLIPLGELWETKGTPMDLNKPTLIGKHIHDDYDQLKYGGGYDHTYVLDHEIGKLIKYAVVKEPTTGRVMECFTTEPGVQLYTASHLNGKPTGKSGIKYKKHSAFCLETQHYPNSPNQANFPSTVLNPGETYKTSTIYKFDTF